MKNPGYIYQFPDGSKGVAYHKEQELNKFDKRVLVRMFNADFTPKISEKTGQQSIRLITPEMMADPGVIKFIGFND